VVRARADQVHQREGPEERREQEPQLRIVQIELLLLADDGRDNAQGLAVEIAERHRQQEERADLPRPPTGSGRTCVNTWNKNVENLPRSLRRQWTGSGNTRLDVVRNSTGAAARIYAEAGKNDSIFVIPENGHPAGP